MKNIIKIFVYTGSCNKHSTTAILAERLVKTIQETTKLRVSADYFSGSNAHIEECVGCTQCFMKGKCTLDVRDDLPVLRKKMMEADCIILGSPVYFHSVSGNMKKYIDRLSYWTHVMELTGKLGVVISTSGGNGMRFVSDYLKKFMDYLGIINVGVVEAVTYNEDYLKSQGVVEKLQPEFLSIAEKIRGIYEEGVIPEPDDLQRAVFKMNNSRYKEMEKYREDIAEVRNWLDKGFTEFESYDEVIADLFKEDVC